MKKAILVLVMFCAAAPAIQDTYRMASS